MMKLIIIESIIILFNILHLNKSPKTNDNKMNV